MGFEQNYGWFALAPVWRFQCLGIPTEESQNTRELGTEVPKTRGYPNRCDTCHLRHFEKWRRAWGRGRLGILGLSQMSVRVLFFQWKVLFCTVAVSAVLLRIEIINLWKTTNLFWTARLVSNDVRLPINSSTAFPFACLNVCFCDRRIHFRFRAFFIFTELKSTAGCFDERRSFVYRQLSHGGFLVDWLVVVLWSLHYLYTRSNMTC